MIPPRYRICLAAHFLAVANVTGLMSTPFFIYDHLNGGVAMSGAFGAAQAAAYALVCLISARFVGRLKHGLHAAAFGIVVFGITFAAMPWLNSPWVCGALSTVGVGAMAIVWPALHSWIGGEPDTHVRSRLMGWFNLAWSSGAAIGPIFAGPMYDYYFRLPFFAVVAIGSCIIVVLLTLPHEHAYFAQCGAAAQEPRTADRRGEPYLFAGWSAVLLANLLVGVARSVYPKRVNDLVTQGELRLLFEEVPAAFLNVAPATKYSWLAVILAGSTAVSFLVLGRTSGWRYNLRWLFASQALAGAAFYALGHTSSLLVMMVCMAVAGANLAVCFFASVYYCLSHPEKKHGRAAINEAMVGIGGLLGSAVFGYLAGRYWFSLPFTWTPALVVFVMALQVVLLAYGRRRAERVFVTPVPATCVLTECATTLPLAPDLPAEAVVPEPDAENGPDEPLVIPLPVEVLGSVEEEQPPVPLLLNEGAAAADDPTPPTLAA